jgi:hypothetical protein
MEAKEITDGELCRIRIQGPGRTEEEERLGTYRLTGLLIKRVGSGVKAFKA